MSLTTMQELFVRALLSDPKRNATTAAINAGYSQGGAKRTAQRLLADPEVQMALHEKQIAALDGANVDPHYVIIGIRDTSNAAAAWAKHLTPSARSKVLSCWAVT